MKSAASVQLTASPVKRSIENLDGLDAQNFEFIKDLLNADQVNFYIKRIITIEKTFIFVDRFLKG